MRRTIHRTLTAALCTIVLQAGVFAHRAMAEETEAQKIAVGYKIGNGIGFAGGDLVWRAVPHVTFDVQAAYASLDGYTGYGLAPTVQFELKPVGHTPYLGLGLVYASLDNGTVSGWAAGFLANAGYQWRFASHVGIMVGAGIDDLGSVHVRAEYAQATFPAGGIHFNFEAGVRYFF